MTRQRKTLVDQTENREHASRVNVAPAPAALIPVAAAATGLSEKAIRRKIEDGVWREGREWFKGPDGHVYIDLWGGFYQWVKGDREAA